MQSYLKVLEDSLAKKQEILLKVESIHAEQEKLLLASTFDLDAFDALVTEKDQLVSKLMKLDEGFENIYERIRERLEESKSKYADQIRNMQTLIADITSRGASIQATEQRIMNSLQMKLGQIRGDIGRGRRSTQAVYGYYKSMSNIGGATSQFLDKKN